MKRRFLLIFLWLSAGHIIAQTTYSKEIEEQVQANPNDKNRLCNNDVLSLYFDKQEQLWVGTSGGLNRLFLQSKPRMIRHNPTPPQFGSPSFRHTSTASATVS